MTKAIFFLLLVPAFAFAQGQIIFENSSETAITDGYTGQRAATATRVGLYANPNPTASTGSPGWVMATGSTNLVAPGVFIGGTRILAGFPANMPVAVQVRAWLTSGSFPNYEAAIAGEIGGAFGHSVVMRITPTAQPALPPTLLESGFQSFFIGIPEPSTLALAGLGLAFLAFGKLARRRTPGR